MWTPSLENKELLIIEVVSALAPLRQRENIPTEGSLVSVFRLDFGLPNN